MSEFQSVVTIYCVTATSAGIESSASLFKLRHTLNPMTIGNRALSRKFDKIPFFRCPYIFVTSARIFSTTSFLPVYNCTRVLSCVLVHDNFHCNFFVYYTCFISNVNLGPLSDIQLLVIASFK